MTIHQATAYEFKRFLVFGTRTIGFMLLKSQCLIFRVLYLNLIFRVKTLILRESGCQTHAMACGAGIGVFLLIKVSVWSFARKLDLFVFLCT